MMQPRDQIAKIKAMAAHHTITCAQLKDLIAIVKTIQYVNGSTLFAYYGSFLVSDVINNHLEVA